MLCNYLLIYNQEESSWISCNSIKSNLIQAYKIAFPNQIVELNIQDAHINKHLVIANEIESLIKKHHISKIIFVDHQPCPALIIEAIEKNILNIQKYSVEIFIHVYGDFTYYLPLFTKIKYPKTVFIAASERQKTLIDQFTLKNTTTNLFFPINENLFYFSHSKRSHFRSQNNIAEKECVILYTGRLSLQKNIEAIFSILTNSSNPNIHLILIGEFDDLGGRFFGATQAIGYYYQKIQDLISKSNFKVTYHHKVDQEKLVEYYCGSDIFISPSLYHDEDFGMSPAEAMACGMTTILSDWGGFASFKGAEFLPVNLTSNGHQIDLAPAVAIINNFDHKKVTPIREEHSQMFLKNFGRIAFSQTIKKTLNLKMDLFQGYTSLAKKYINNYLNCENKLIKPIYINIVSSDNIYGEIYQAYLNPEKKSIKLVYNVQWLNDSILNQNNIDFLNENSFFAPALPHSAPIYMHPSLVFIAKKSTAPQLIRSGINYLPDSNYKNHDYLPIELADTVKGHKKFYTINSQCNHLVTHAYLIIVPGYGQHEILDQLKKMIETHQLKSITFLDTSKNTTLENDFEFIKIFLNNYNIEFKYEKWKHAISKKLILRSGVIEINDFQTQGISYCTFFLMSQDLIKLTITNSFNSTKHQVAPYINLELIELPND